MGLDVIAIYPIKEPVRRARLEKARDAPDELFAGVFTGYNSFRGRRYAEYVLEVTGESLYFHYIRPEDVKEMAVKLEKAAEEYTDEDFEELEITRQEARELARWFKVAAEHGFALYCSW
ncbi:MAG: hypothetical protein H5T97_09640 [Firmicutes bacterium]|nr:hypothetical protein [Bacillota bacterium]